MSCKISTGKLSNRISPPSSIVRNYSAGTLSMAWCKTTVSPVHEQWRYCSLTLNHRYHFHDFGDNQSGTRALFQYKDCLSRTVFQYNADSHYNDKTVVRPSYLCNGKLYTPGKMVSLYWASPQCFCSATHKAARQTTPISSYQWLRAKLEHPHWRYCSFAPTDIWGFFYKQRITKPSEIRAWVNNYT